MTDTTASNVAPEPMTFLATCDISSRTKGRAMPAKNVNEGTSVGWVPANLGIGPLGHIVEDIPWGSTGDLRLKPDFNAQYPLTNAAGELALNVVFSNIVETDGAESEQCTRTYLQNTVQALKDEFGLIAQVSVEFEFVDLSLDFEHHPFSLKNYLKQEPLGSKLVAALSNAGVNPENWLAEYGEHQFEITMRPSDPVTAGDRAVFLRDQVYEIFEGNGHRVTFAPVPRHGGGGSGMHMHFGLLDENGNNAVYDRAGNERVSELGARFAQGIVAHAAEMAAFFAPLVNSYDRLAPHNWSTARAFTGVQNREALVRVTPTNEIDGQDPAPQLHFEFRGGDAGVNPWLLINLVLRAGLEGLRQNMEPATIVRGELDLDDEHKDLPALPTSLGEALDTLENGTGVRTWFSENFISNYVTVKRAEIEELKGKSPEEICEAYTRAL